MKVTAIVGSYHKGGIIDTAVDEILSSAARQGAQIQKIDLLNKHIEFCRNCQSCCQEPGEKRGKCIFEDDMSGILDAIDASDAIILASPMNFWTVTALMKRFIERLICYGYWPWNKAAPAARIKNGKKRAIIVASCAAPGVMGRYLTGMNTVMKRTVRMLGAGRVESFFIGLARNTPTSSLSPRARSRAAKMGQVLVSPV